MKKRVKDYDLFYLSYDEPLKEEFWQKNKAKIPWAQRVDGVKGFDKAHKRCAEISKTERFFVVDGDCLVTPDFPYSSFHVNEGDEKAVLSWASENIINGLCYGNGGIKCWPRDVALEMETHEEAQQEEAQVDFCFVIRYLQMPGEMGKTYINGSSFQAFRSGFREGVKMTLEKGKRWQKKDEQIRGCFTDYLNKSNQERLRIWCSVGKDQKFGDWAIYGARLGCHLATLSDWDTSLIKDHDWISEFWSKQVKKIISNKEELNRENVKIGSELNVNLGLQIVDLDEGQSVFVRSIYRNPERQGFMLND